jgi:hypothetical protein
MTRYKDDMAAVLSEAARLSDELTTAAQYA